VAALAAVFAARGGYETPQSFVDGTVPALWVGAAAVAAAAVATLFIPRTRKRAEYPEKDLAVAA